ncbi:AMP-binding protein [Vibrio vulnificus]
MALALVNGDLPNHPLWHLQSLEQALREAADSSDSGIEFIDENGERSYLSYGDFYQKAISVGHVLIAHGIERGDRVIIRVEEPAEFLFAFWGIVLVGAVAVPLSAYQPLPSGREASKGAIDTLLAIEPKAIICSRKDLGALTDVVKAHADLLLPVINANDFLTLESSSEPLQSSTSKEDLAVIFPTSGSTGQPKLVPQTVDALLSMAAGSVQMNRFDSSDVFLNWMPMDHVGSLAFLSILPVCAKSNQIHCNTAWVRQDIRRFLMLLTEYKVTAGWVPNHVFNQVEKLAIEPEWDLSHLYFLVNAGESISDNMERCAQLLSQCGLQRHAFRPAFGMSETCSGITWSQGIGAKVKQAVDLGSPIPGASIRVVSAAGEIKQQGEVGCLQVRGPSVTKGYLYHSSIGEGWFDTGDNAVIFNDKVYITDREGDAVDGLSVPAYQIEGEIDALHGIQAGMTAVCQVSGVLGVFYVVEANADLLGLSIEIEALLKGQSSLPYQLFCCDQRDIPRTSIGKIQRKLLRRRLAEELDLEPMQ